MNSKLEDILSSVPVDQWQTQNLILLYWHDGPVEGICELDRPVCTFYFRLIGACYNPDGLDDRIFHVSDLPELTVEQLTAISAHATKIPTQQSVESDVDPADENIKAILKMRGKPVLIIRTVDMEHFTAMWNFMPFRFSDSS